MKNIFIIFLVCSICSCENNSTLQSILESNDVEQIKLKRKEITALKEEISNKLQIIDNKLDELNTNPQLPIVEIMTVSPVRFDHYVQVQGSVKSDELINIFPELSGVIKNIYVKSGDIVKKGEPLLKIDDGGLKEQLSQLEIGFELTKTTYERQKRLWAQNIGSEIKFLETKSMFEAQKQGLNQLKKQIKKTLIEAPFSGTIDNVVAKKGEVVYPGRSNLMMLLNLDNLYIESNVPEKYIALINSGNKAVVHFPLLDKTILTNVRQSGNYINPTNRTFKIELDIEKNNLNIKPNLNSKVNINDYSNEEALMVNQNIISIDSNNKEYVYKVYTRDNMTYVAKTLINTGKNDGVNIEVLSGLMPNDKIVTEGIRKLIDNSRVKIIN
jgi:RND family efflux transporter MFP subunit